jgi:hypothetical protein
MEDSSGMADDISKRIPGFIEPFRVNPGSNVKLARDFDPAFDPQYPKRDDDALRDLQTAKFQLERDALTGAAADSFEAQAG